MRYLTMQGIFTNRAGSKLTALHNTVVEPCRTRFVLSKNRSTVGSLLIIVTLMIPLSFSQAATIVGGEVEVTLHSAQEFGAAGIGVTLIGPTGVIDPHPILVFPIIGGDTSTGLVQLGGGVIFSDGVNDLAVTNFVVDLFANTTTVDTSLNGGPNQTVLRSNNFNCAAMPGSCFETDRTTPIDDPAYSGLVFSAQAQARLDDAFPNNPIDFSAMLPDVSQVTSLQVIPLPGMAMMFAMSALGLFASYRGVATRPAPL